MKLLVDENLSPSLATKLSDLFSGSIHVREAGLSATPDASIWDYAKREDFAILTKDQDFVRLSSARGAPPKVIILETRNCSSADAERIVRANAIRLSELNRDPERTFLILRKELFTSQ